MPTMLREVQNAKGPHVGGGNPELVDLYRTVLNRKIKNGFKEKESVHILLSFNI